MFGSSPFLMSSFEMFDGTPLEEALAAEAAAAVSAFFLEISAAEVTSSKPFVYGWARMRFSVSSSLFTRCRKRASTSPDLRS